MPEFVDGAMVTVDLPAIVSATYGDCGAAIDTKPEGFDPDDPSTFRMRSCVNLVQMASPTITAPPGINLQQIGQVYLELMGMEPEDAARFSQKIDWSTTLVIPLPIGESEYSEVSVDGVTGTLIRSFGDYNSNFTLLWVADGIVYALTGDGSPSTALTIANSLK
jgi:hypothetical protein